MSKRVLIGPRCIEVELYILDNKIPLRSENWFEEEHHEHPGWSSEMSLENRGLSLITPHTREHEYMHPQRGCGVGWNYRDTWVKKLKRLEK